MQTEAWKCSCGAELVVARVPDGDMPWESIRCKTCSVTLWNYNDGAWWHYHKKGGWKVAALIKQE